MASVKHIEEEDPLTKEKKECRSPHCNEWCICEGRCPDCGGQIEWCTSCNMWTQTCCETYGTCACS